MGNEFLAIDLPALIIVTLASALCAILGSFLILKRQAVMVDAISHSVLPGIVTGVLLSGSFAMVYVMGGALLSALIAISLVYLLEKFAKIEQGAAIGAVFTAMFASGVMLLELKMGTRIHLDTQHVLYGALELTYWPVPMSWDTMPRQIKTLLFMLILTIVFTALIFKELRITTFDSQYATVIGYNIFIIQFPLMILMALAAVSCFEATGSILVISLFICPAAAARLLTDDLQRQLYISVIIAISCAVVGYFLSALMPLWFDFGQSVNSAATIAVLLGLNLVTIAIITYSREAA